MRSRRQGLTSEKNLRLANLEFVFSCIDFNNYQFALGIYVG